MNKTKCVASYIMENKTEGRTKISFKGNKLQLQLTEPYR